MNRGRDQRPDSTLLPTLTSDSYAASLNMKSTLRGEDLEWKCFISIIWDNKVLYQLGP